MSIRARALQWFGNRRLSSNHVVTSRRYLPHESWTKEKAWWVQIPLRAIRAGRDIDLLLEAELAGEEFHHLRVPAEFIIKRLPKFALIGEDKINLFLAIDPGSEFVDQRGPGRVSFRQFVQTAR